MSDCVINQARCAHCGGSFGVPDLSAESRSKVATHLREGHPSFAAQVLWEDGGLNLADSISVIGHITEHPGVCRNCRADLSGASQSECQNCHALNLDW